LSDQREFFNAHIQSRRKAPDLTWRRQSCESDLWASRQDCLLHIRAEKSGDRRFGTGIAKGRVLGGLKPPRLDLA